MIASRVIFAQRVAWRRNRERLAMWVAWHLPRWLVMWCYIRVVAKGTTGEWDGTVPNQLNVMEALRRWDGQEL